MEKKKRLNKMKINIILGGTKCFMSKKHAFEEEYMNTLNNKCDEYVYKQRCFCKLQSIVLHLQAGN